MKKKFVKLTNVEGNGNVYLNMETETLKEVVDVPKDDKYPARTRVTTTKGIAYLVSQPAKEVMSLCGLS